MKKWAGGCVDKKTGLEMILSDAGYNEACFFVEQRFAVRDVRQVRDSDGNNITIFETATRHLIFDENRAVLVGD